MRRAYLIALILWIHLGDLVTAWLYGGGALPGAALVRPLRDSTIIATALLCLLTVNMPSSLLLPILIYGLFAAIYLPVGWLHDLPWGVLVGSFGTLMIPMLLFLVGYYCLRTPREIKRSVLLLASLGVASTLLGIWEIEHTEFWTQTLSFPAYVRDLKGVALGADPNSGLPWSFYGGVDWTRRSAGLVAAPLAQGSFLAVTGIASLAMSQGRKLWLGIVICAIVFIGVLMSGTRGAMLVGSLALLGYLATNRHLIRGFATRLILAGLLLLAISLASRDLVSMSVNFLDGSTFGHWTALIRNLSELHRVLLFGGGLGRQGAIAAQEGLANLGGGEGAIFSITFQMGVPAALVFLWFYASCVMLLWRANRYDVESPGLAMFWLSCGMSVTLVSSEHILSVSGAGAFWLLVGGTIRSAFHEPEPAMAGPAAFSNINHAKT